MAGVEVRAARPGSASALAAWVGVGRRNAGAGAWIASVLGTPLGFRV